MWHSTAHESYDLITCEKSFNFILMKRLGSRFINEVSYLDVIIKSSLANIIPFFNASYRDAQTYRARDRTWHLKMTISRMHVCAQISVSLRWALHMNATYACIVEALFWSLTMHFDFSWNVLRLNILCIMTNNCSKIRKFQANLDGLTLRI